MDKLVIRGGNALTGQIKISGAKNAALPLMCASLLTDQPVTLHNLPRLADITTLADLLNHLGVEVTIAAGNGNGAGRTMLLRAENIADTTAPYDMVRKMRASILVLGPLVAREGVATVSLPGGCAIGNRPIDLHLKGLQQLGAEIDLADGYVRAKAAGGLKGGKIHFPMVSVGATENLMMAASLARGTSILENAAKEPEISDLARLLNAMGAKITGAGSERITIEGVASLRAANHPVMPDRIEAGSYAVAAAITGGTLDLLGARSDMMGATLDALREAGGFIAETAQGLTVGADKAGLRGINIKTQPYPGFPTDMQAQFMVMLAKADGASVISETIFENRFMHVPELARMGADITVAGPVATIRGVKVLRGAPVMATDLRASMSLVLAGLAADGETVISRIYHLDRGYERLEEKLKAAGADIERVPA